MEHLTKGGESKLVAQCDYPITGIGVVTRVYTDLAVIDITSAGLFAYDLVPGLSFEELQRLSGVALSPRGISAAASSPRGRPPGASGDYPIAEPTGPETNSIASILRQKWPSLPLDPCLSMMA